MGGGHSQAAIQKRACGPRRWSTFESVHQEWSYLVPRYGIGLQKVGLDLYWVGFELFWPCIDPNSLNRPGWKLNRPDWHKSDWMSPRRLPMEF
ncbi:hypothetical protein CRG98_007492 [Punica granatum]|uniref:Uncharacterized protein n=1 Tax=Punica granatum TaxID=22663 RepID=A0A2I0KUF1_PUNGR|nr:hypothetical protein CRG98_007492 [Punica granatum]